MAIIMGTCSWYVVLFKRKRMIAWLNSREMDVLNIYRDGHPQLILRDENTKSYFPLGWLDSFLLFVHFFSEFFFSCIIAWVFNTRWSVANQQQNPDKIALATIKGLWLQDKEVLGVPTDMIPVLWSSSNSMLREDQTVHACSRCLALVWKEKWNCRWERHWFSPPEVTTGEPQLHALEPQSNLFLFLLTLPNTEIRPQILGINSINISVIPFSWNSSWITHPDCWSTW